jgi:hypothetical protein
MMLPLQDSRIEQAQAKCFQRLQRLVLQTDKAQAKGWSDRQLRSGKSRTVAGADIQSPVTAEPNATPAAKQVARPHTARGIAVDSN